MQLFSIGVGERDTGIKEALFRKIRSRKPDGLDIEEKKSRKSALSPNYISDKEYDSSTIEQLREQLNRYIADIISELILEDMQSRLVEEIIQDEYFLFWSRRAQ